MRESIKSVSTDPQKKSFFSLQNTVVFCLTEANQPTLTPFNPSQYHHCEWIWWLICLYIWFQKTAADGKRQEIIVLDSKRSNAINIGLTVLPPPRTIKTAILNFDEYALSKEGIEVTLHWFKITFRFANYDKSTTSNEANSTWWNY